MKIYLSHNPFLVKTVFQVDDQEHAALTELFSSRLQEWVEKLFFEIYNQLGQPSNINLTFQGLLTDYEDVEQAAIIADQEYDLNINLQHIEVLSVEERVEILDRLIQDSKNAPEIEMLQGDDVKQLENNGLVSAYNTAMNSDFNIHIIATMSSGKSTVINSLLGTELLPAANMATTARIARIYDDSSLEGKGFEGEIKTKDQDPKERVERISVDKKQLNIWNKQKDIKEINIYGEIPYIYKNDYTRLVLTDTPGPNNSQDPKHKKVTEIALKDEAKPLIIYVLDMKGVGTDDDRLLLNRVKKERLGGDSKQSRDRFIFLINKIDGIDPESEDETVADIIENVRGYLTNSSDNQEMAIVDPIIIPISAITTLLVRKFLSGNDRLTTKEKEFLNTSTTLFNNFENVHLMQYMDVSPYVKRNVEKKLEDIKNNNELSEQEKNMRTASIHSGIPVLESLINEYLIKYSIPLKIARAKEHIDEYLKQLKNALEFNRKNLSKSEGEKIELERSLSVINDELKSGKSAEIFKNKIKSNSNKLDNNIKNKISEDVLSKCGKKFLEIGNGFNGATDDEYHAKQLVEKAKDNYDYFRNQIIVFLEKFGSKCQEDEEKKLKAGFIEHIRSLFEENNFDFDIKKFSESAVNLAMHSIDSSNTVNRAKSVSRVKAGEEREWFGEDTTWYNPLTWTYKREIYKNQTNIDLEEIFYELQVKFDKDIKEIIQSAIEHIEKSINNSRNVFIEKVGKELDLKISENIDKLNIALLDKDKAEEDINRLKNILDWIQTFEEKLEAVYEF